MSCKYCGNTENKCEMVLGGFYCIKQGLIEDDEDYLSYLEGEYEE